MSLVFLSPSLANEPARTPQVDLTVGWSGAYRPDQWCPLDFTLLHTGQRPLDAALTARLEGDGSTRVSLHHDAVMTPGVPRVVPLVAMMGPYESEVDVRLTGPDGRSIWEHTFGGRMDALAPTEVLIGVVGPTGGALEALEAADMDREQAEQDQQDKQARQQAGSTSPPVAPSNEPEVEMTSDDRVIGSAIVRSKGPERLPIDWTGYAPLDVLVLRDTDVPRLDPASARAIVQWVGGHGGSLLLVLTAGAIPPDSPLAELLPFDVHAQQPTLIDAQDVFGVPCPEPVRSLLGPPPGDPCWQWRGRPAYFGWGMVGFGRVGVLGFDPFLARGAPGPQRQRVWRECLNAVLVDRALRTPDMKDGTRKVPMYRMSGPRGIQFAQAGDDAREQLSQVLEHLMSIRQLRPLSGWVVMALLAGLALLIGPVDYFVLKRLDRQPWTHVTMVAYVGLFTAGAYVGVHNYRAGRSEARAVTVIDAAPAQRPWMTTFAGVFASQAGAYPFSPATTADTWWSPLSALNYYYQRTSADRRLDLYQGDGACRPDVLGIRVWSMQCLQGEGPCPQLPLKVTARRAGGKLGVRVDNVTDVPAVRVRVFAGLNGTPPRNLAPHTGWQVEDMSSEPRAGLAALRQWCNGSNQPSSCAMLAGPCARRLDALTRHLDSGAVVVVAQFDQAPMPFEIPGRQYNKDHVQYVRVVVMPQESPADDAGEVQE